MFKKIASLLVAATMMVSAAAITASAAETDEVAPVAAGDTSSEVGADGSSEVGADSSSEVGASNTYNFDVKSVGWNNVKTIYCHIYSADGSGTWTAWQTKAEKCTYDTSTGIASYDIQTGIKKAPDLANIDSSNKWLIIFSSDTSMETYPALLNSNCLGDVLYAPDPSKMYENNLDSEKKSVAVQWKKSGLGASKCITSTGKIQGESFADGASNVTLMSEYYIAYYADAAKLDLTQSLFDQLGSDVYTVDVYNSCVEKLQQQIKDDKIKEDEANKALEAILADLNKITGHNKPAGGSDDPEPTLPDKADVKTTVPAGNSGSGSGSSGSGSGSSGSGSGSSSSGSGSVSSGQETTTLFVFGGVMLLAAGIIFVARKRKED